MEYIFIGIVLLAVGFAMLCATPGARYKRLARTLGLRYDKQLDNPLTPHAAKHLHWFDKGLHQFSNVLTWHEPGLFMRVCEERIYTSPLDKHPQAVHTLVTAELTRGTFYPLQLSPATEVKADPALPAQPATRFSLQTPSTYPVPTLFTALLQNASPCYLETTPDALVYHEYHTVPLAQLQPLRMRAKAFATALLCKPATQQDKAPAPAVSAEDFLLQLQTKPAEQPLAGPRWGYGWILFIVLGMLLLLCKYILSLLTAR